MNTLLRDAPFKICFVASVPPPFGGIGRWSMQVLGYLGVATDIRHHVVNISPRWGRKVYDYARWKRITGGGLQLMIDLVLLLKAILYHRCTIVHLTTSGRLAVFRDIYMITMANIFSVPVVYHIHFGRIPELALAQTLEWRLLAFAMKRADVVVVIDAASEAAMKRHLPCVRVEYIPNCINIAELPSVSVNGGKPATAVFLGWVVPEKGIEELIEAWARMQARDWNLRIIGPGDVQYQQELVRKYAPSGVAFLGELSHEQAMEELAHADMFVLPSYTEGFPNVILEAMSMGKPVIATDVGAIPEMLSGDCGILVPAKNAGALRKELERITADPGMAREMGKRAKNRVLAQYSIEVVFKRYLSVWQNAMEKQTARSYRVRPVPGERAY